MRASSRRRFRLSQYERDRCKRRQFGASSAGPPEDQAITRDLTVGRVSHACGRRRQRRSQRCWRLSVNDPDSRRTVTLRRPARFEQPRAFPRIRSGSLETDPVGQFEAIVNTQGVQPLLPRKLTLPQNRPVQEHLYQLVCSWTSYHGSWPNAAIDAEMPDFL